MQFTCFTSTEVQILTLMRLPERERLRLVLAVQCTCCTSTEVLILTLMRLPERKRLRLVLGSSGPGQSHMHWVQVWQRVTLYADADVCSRMLTYADVCSRMRAGAIAYALGAGVAESDAVC